MVWEDLCCDKVWQFSIFLSCMVLGESYGLPLLNTRPAARMIHGGPLYEGLTLHRIAQ